MKMQGQITKLSFVSSKEWGGKMYHNHKIEQGKNKGTIAFIDDEKPYQEGQVINYDYVDGKFGKEFRNHSLVNGGEKAPQMQAIKQDPRQTSIPLSPPPQVNPAMIGGALHEAVIHHQSKLNSTPEDVVATAGIFMEFLTGKTSS